MENIRFKGVMPALLTPYDDNQCIDAGAVEAMVEWMLARGVHGFYVCGNTGEGPLLRPKARVDTLEAVIRANRGRGRVIAHIGAPNFLDAAELTRHAEKAGADGVASLPPTYSVAYSQDELVDYYRAIAQCTSLPVMVYAHASTQVSDYPALMRRLMDIPGVIGLKCTLPQYYLMQQMKLINGGNINVLNGPDQTLLCGLVMGADGGIGTTYNLMPDWFVALYNAFLAGDMRAAMETQARINRVIAVLLRYDALKATKAAMSFYGLPAGHAAYPAHRFGEAELAALREELTEAGCAFA